MQSLQLSWPLNKFTKKRKQKSLRHKRNTTRSHILMTKKNHSLTNSMEKNTSTRIIMNQTIKKRSMTTKTSQNTPKSISMIITMN